MSCKYNNFGLDTGRPIEIDITRGQETARKSGRQIISKVGGHSSRKLSPVSSEKKDDTNSINFSRVKAQNMTGFTNDSIVTGTLEGASKTPLGNRKLMTKTMFPNISAVEQFYERN